MNSLPDEILCIIFAYLRGKQVLLYASPVCKLFYRIATSTDYWQQACATIVKYHYPDYYNELLNSSNNTSNNSNNNYYITLYKHMTQWHFSDKWSCQELTMSRADNYKTVVADKVPSWSNIMVSEVLRAPYTYCITIKCHKTVEYKNNSYLFTLGCGSEQAMNSIGPAKSSNQCVIVGEASETMALLGKYCNTISSCTSPFKHIKNNYMGSEDKSFLKFTPGDEFGMRIDMSQCTPQSKEINATVLKRLQKHHDNFKLGNLYLPEELSKAIDGYSSTREELRDILMKHGSKVYFYKNKVPLGLVFYALPFETMRIGIGTLAEGSSFEIVHTH